MLRLVVVDDENAIRNVITNMVNRYCPDVQIVGQANSVRSGIDMVTRLRPDLLFVDIEMRDGTGFELLQKINLLKTKVVIISAYNEYALKAIKYRVFDFILKPIDPQELTETIEKMKESFEKEGLHEMIHQVANKIHKNRKFTVKTENNVHFINSRDIVRCESDGNYTRFYHSNGSTIMVSKTLKFYDSMLSGYDFFRAHKSHLVNINFIVRYDKSSGGMLFFEDNSFIPVASRKKEGLLNLLEQL